MTFQRWLARCSFILILAIPIAAHANYRCVGADGKKYYGQAIPPACTGVPVEQLDSAGRVVRRVEPPAASQPTRDADPAQLRAEEAAARRDRALLATYGSEAEIEQARELALRSSAGADTAAINARYDADLKRYRELLQERQNAPLRMQKGVRIVKPRPAPQPPRRQYTEEPQGRDVVEMESRMLREYEQQQREAPPPRVLRIDQPAPSPELSSPSDTDAPSTMQRDDRIHFPGRQGPAR
jgi:hypothetical protein